MKQTLMYKIAVLIFLGAISFHSLEASRSGAGAGVGASAGNGETPGVLGDPTGTTAARVSHPTSTATVLPTLPDFPAGPVQDYRLAINERENKHTLTELEMLNDIDRLRLASDNDTHYEHLKSFYVGLKAILLQDVLKILPDPRFKHFYGAISLTAATSALTIWQVVKGEYTSAFASFIGAAVTGVSVYNTYKASAGSLKIYDYERCPRRRHYSQELRSMSFEVIKGKIHEITIAAALKYREGIRFDFRADRVNIDNFRKYLVTNLLMEHEYATVNYSLNIIEKVRERETLNG